MKITYNDITIDFFDFEDGIPEQVVISLSGGLDSASVLYLGCKHFPEIEFIPFCARDVNAPKDADAAVDIIKWMKKEFPNVNIKDIEIYEFNDRDESVVSFADCDEAIKKYKQYSALNRVQMSKIIQLTMISRSLADKYPKSVKVDGMTANPPDKIMKKEGWLHLSEKRRSQKKTNRIKNKKRLHQPFIDVDKKFVADIYKQNNLMDTLYPLTRSCVGTERTTDNFTKECHQCFWCYEKKWAFDLNW